MRKQKYILRNKMKETFYIQIKVPDWIYPEEMVLMSLEELDSMDLNIGIRSKLRHELDALEEPIQTRKTRNTPLKNRGNWRKQK